MTERLLDEADPRGPSINTRADFAAELTALRERAGLTIRDVAKATGLQTSTLGGYFSGRHLPPVKPADALTAILNACDVTDVEQIAHWHERLRKVRRAPGPRPAAAGVPYRGLSTFQPEDAQWFFGRETLTQTLVNLVRHGDPMPSALLLVVGPSGAGKSSLLRAGLVAAIGDAPYLLLTPGPDPLRSLSEGMDKVQIEAGERLLVVIDQFEEVFTLCPDEAQQTAFISQICALAQKPGCASVVLGLRADFYSRALSHPGLARVAQESQLIVGPMSEDELRRAIEEPARRANVDIEPGLVELYLRDLSDPLHRGSSSTLYEAGSLPLLSHALLATWQTGRGRRLTVANYTEAGGIHGAVAQTAERVYSGLSAQQRQLARRLFVQMVIVGDETADTRRRVQVGQLADDDDDAYEVLELFVDNRLLIIDSSTVEICHEALIRAWPRLRTWIEEDRASLLVGQQVAEAAERWRSENRDPGALYRGARLAVARQWEADSDHGRVGPLSREFISASLRQQRRSARRLYQSIAGLAALLVLAAGAGVVALQQRAEATRERNAAISRLVATVADRVRAKDAALAAQLSLAAYRIAETKEARSSLLDTSATPAVTRLLGGAGVMQSVALSPDKSLLAAGGADKLIRLWDLTDTRTPRLLTPLLDGPTDTIFSVAISPDGTTLAAAGGDKAVYLWNISDRRNPMPIGEPLLGPTALVYSLAFSPDGKMLAAGSGDHRIHLWDLTDARQPRRLHPPLTGATGYIQAVAFSPDGRLLAAGSADKTVRLWDVTDPQGAKQIGAAISGPQRTVYSVAFSPDGLTLAAGSADSQVYLWDVHDPWRPARLPGPIPGRSGWVNSVAFSADGLSLAYASSASEVRVVDLKSMRLLAVLPHPGPVTGLVFSDNAALLTSAADGVARIWHPPWPVISGQGDIVSAVTFNRQGSILAIGSAETQLWDATRRTPLSTSMTNPARYSTTVAHTPDGSAIAVASRDGTIQMWNIADPNSPTPIGPPLAAHSELIESITFAPNGKMLASGGDDNVVRLWDAADLSDLRPLATLDGFRSYVYSVTFSPDGRTLAAASIDKTVRLWDVSDPQRPQLLGEPLPVSDHYALAVAFSPDGRTLAVGSADKAVRLYDVANLNHPIQIGPPLGGPTNYVYALAFTGDGRTLAAASTDENVWLWDVSDRTQPLATATLTAPTGAIYSISFHPNGHTLAAGGADKTVWLWETDPQRVTEAICTQAGDPITIEEWNQYVPTLEYQAPCSK